MYHKKPTQNEDKYKYSGPLRPGKVSARLSVLEDIPKPDWAYTGFPKEEQESMYQKNIIVNEKKDIENMRYIQFKLILLLEKFVFFQDKL